MVAIYILAGIGGFCLLVVVGMVLSFIFPSAPDPEGKKEDEEKTYICALTDCNCIYVGGHGNCITCPVREEAEKIGNR
jgi:hypothetical protein